MKAVEAGLGSAPAAAQEQQRGHAADEGEGDRLAHTFLL